MSYQDCRCGALLRVAKAWTRFVCGICGSFNEVGDFPLAAAGESAKLSSTIQRRRTTGVEGPMNAPSQFAPKEAHMVAEHSIKAGA